MLATQFVESYECMLFFLPIKLAIVHHHMLYSCHVSITTCGGHQNALRGLSTARMVIN